VVNRCRDVQRRRRVQRRHDASARGAARAAEPSSELGADELSDALAKLPMRQRTALVLRFYDGRSEAEIATVLGVAPGTVKSLVSRALAQLREVIEP
jgi:RNA polymerase sigma factor (sigma-70 family)